MNKHCFRVIFSQVRQCLIVVSELVNTQGKSNDKNRKKLLRQPLWGEKGGGDSDLAHHTMASPSREVTATVRPLVFSLLCSLGMVTYVPATWAELMIQADPTATHTQQAIILETANGIPLVNIQTPNAQGVSHNRYRQFDVDTSGAILNNSRTHTQTQLGGWVQGNPYLARGEARVILNEVNSSNPSLLKGYVEVAGRQAEVIIANPSGIHCEGCGLINASRATLTTGQPQFQAGNLEGFIVEKGKVSVAGKGLDNSQVNYTDILARQVELNSGLWSKKKATVVTGHNQVKYPIDEALDKSSPAITVLHDPEQKHTPHYEMALDVSELGGMYAGKIHLIGTEEGVGVRNTGHIGANAEGLRIDSQGRIVNTGRLSSSTTLDLTAKQAIENKGTLTQAGRGIIGAEVKIDTSDLDNQGGGIYATQQLELAVKESLNNTRGEILAEKTLSIEGQQDPSTASSPSHLLSNLRIINEEGLIQAGEAVNIHAKSFPSHGMISSAGDITLNLRDDFTLSSGFEVSETLNVKTAGSFKNLTVQKVGKQLNIHAKSIDNKQDAELLAQDKVFLSAESIHNQGLVDARHTWLKGQDIHNQGEGRLYGDHISLEAENLQNSALSQGDKTTAAVIASRERLDFGGGTLSNRDHALILSLGEMHTGSHLDAQGRALGKATFIDNGSATIEVLGDARLETKRLLNHDLYLQTGIEATKEYMQEHSPLNSSAVYYTAGSKKEGYMYWNNESRRDSRAYMRFYDGRTPVGSPHWMQRNYIRTTDTTTITHHDSAKIAVGGNLTLKGEELLNNASRILVGKKLILGEEVFEHNEDNQSLVASNIRLENRDVIGEIHQSDKGFEIPIYAVRKRKRLKKVWSHYEGIPDDLDRVLPVQTFAFQRVENTIGEPVVIDAQTHGQTHVKEMDIKPEMSLSDRVLSSNALYRIYPDAPKGYVIETDPRFTDRRQWLSSDYLFNALRYDHERVHKRLGDGFYEQRLIAEQVAELTGRRYLEGYENDLEQYQALMQEGVEYAKAFNLSLGVALTPEQMKALTSNMVWMVKETVTLPDGQQMQVLTPKVYLAPNHITINAREGLISAQHITGNIATLSNRGSMVSDRLELVTQDLDNQGRIEGKNLHLSAHQTLSNHGGEIQAEENITLSAGKHLEIASTVSHSEHSSGKYRQKSVDRVASVKMSGKDGTLNLYSEGSIALNAADIASAGSITALAKEKLTVGSVALEYKLHHEGNKDNYYRLSQSKEVGSTLLAQNDVTLVSGDTMHLRQSNVSAEKDKVMIGSTQGDVTIEAGRSEESLSSSAKTKTRSLTSRTTVLERHQHQISEAIGSEIDGKHVQIFTPAGDVNIKGSDVVAENGLSITAKDNIHILSDKNTLRVEDFYSKKKSGLLSTTALKTEIGQRKETLEQEGTKESAARSQVGSLHGDVQIQAGQHYQQTGSDVATKEGDVNIVAQSADIEAARNDYESHYKYTFEQKGLTVGVTGAVASAVQAVTDTVKSVQSLGTSKNNRINAMGAVNAGFEAMRTADQLKGAADALGNGDNGGSAVGVTITYGEQKLVQTQYTKGNTVAKSQLNAGGQVNVHAVGQGADSDISLQGADVGGLKGTHLQADGDIYIRAIDENHLERSKNKSTGFNAGVAIEFGSNGMAFGVTFGGNLAKGYGNGDSQAWAASTVGYQNSETSLNSKKDTKLLGSQVKGNRVELNAQSLTVDSLQDSATFKGKQEGVSGQVTVGYGVSASASYNQSKIKADYASVNTQAGIMAGDGGYAIHIQDHTQLTGGLITSSEEAEKLGKNVFSTGTLRAVHMDNHASYQGSSVGISGSVAMNIDTPLGNSEHGITQSQKQIEGEDGKLSTAHGMDSLTGGTAVGVGLDSDHQSSQTRSGINTANLIIRDAEAQLTLTGQTVDDIRQQVKTGITLENAEAHSGKLVNNFNQDQVQKELDYQVKVLQDFKNITLPQIEQKVSAYAQRLQEQAKEAKEEGRLSDAQALQQTADKWSKGGAYYQALTAFTNGMGLYMGGASTAGVVTGIASPYINSEIKHATQDNSTSNLIAHGVWGAIEGSTQGGTALSGATAAIVGEAGAQLLSQSLYGDTPPEKLTISQKQTISELSQLFAGVGAGAAALSTGANSLVTGQSIATGQAVAKNAVENNLLTPETIWDATNIAIGSASFFYNVQEGNYGLAVLDGVGVVYDSMATAVPFLPAGVSAGIKAYRTGNSVKQSVAIAGDVAKTAKAAHQAAKDPKNLVGSARAVGSKIHRDTGHRIGEASGKASKLSDNTNSYFISANKATGKQPDLSWNNTDVWGDLTTSGQWNAHVRRYEPTFGTTAIPIIYERGKGVVNSPKLKPGASVIINVPVSVYDYSGVDK